MTGVIPERRTSDGNGEEHQKNPEFGKRKDGLVLFTEHEKNEKSDDGHHVPRMEWPQKRQKILRPADIDQGPGIEHVNGSIRHATTSWRKNIGDTTPGR